MLRNQFHPGLFPLIIFVILMLISSASYAQTRRHDDVVMLKNGDRLTGEIQGLQHGELKFKADYIAEAVILDWSKVERLESRDRYLIDLIDGQLNSDSLRLASGSITADNFFIGGEKSAVRVRQMSVLKITPVKADKNDLRVSTSLGWKF